MADCRQCLPVITLWMNALSDAPVKIQLHLGDYARDTEALSMMEHGAYWGLMRWYYSMAKPIPNDPDRIYRRLSAHSKEERHAIDYVLPEFFSLHGNVWMHKRIEEELAQWRANTETARQNARSRWVNHLRNVDNVDENVSNHLDKDTKNNDDQKKKGKALKNNHSSHTGAERTQSDGNAEAMLAFRLTPLRLTPLKETPPPLPVSNSLGLSAEDDQNAATAAAKTVIKIPVQGELEAEVTQAMVDEWAQLYPDVDIPATLREIRGYNLANPKKRKAPDELMAHIDTWLRKDQVRGS